MRRVSGGLFPAVAVLAAALFLPSPASATLTDDVAAVLPDTGPVTEIPAEAVPSLPVPVETPDLPKVPAPPPPSSPTPKPSATDVAEGTVRGAVGEVEDEATGAPMQAEEPAAPFGFGSPSEPSRGLDSGGSDRRSVAPAEAAPLRRWRAYVWPAIALRIGDALGPVLARLDGLVRVEVPEVFGSLTSPGVSGSATIDPHPERSGLLGQNLQSPSGSVLPAGGMGLLVALLIGLLMALCLVSLARLVVGEELFEVSRWRNHRH